MIDIAQLTELIRSVVREEIGAIAKTTPPKLVTVKAYAEARSISQSTVRKRIKDGDLPAEKVGTAVRIPADAEITKLIKPAKPANEDRADQILRLVTKAGGR